MAGESRIPASLQRWRLRAEDKVLDFEFEVLSAQFNRRGRYALRLSVENPLLRDSGDGVRLRIGDGDSVPTRTGTTDTVLQGHLGEICAFQRKKFTFTLPRGEMLDAMGMGLYSRRPYSVHCFRDGLMAKRDTWVGNLLLSTPIALLLKQTVEPELVSKAPEQATALVAWKGHQGLTQHSHQVTARTTRTTMCGSTSKPCTALGPY